METLIINQPIKNFKNIPKNMYNKAEIYNNYIDSFSYLNELDISEVKVHGLLNKKQLESLQECKNITKLVLVKTKLPNLNVVKQMHLLKYLMISFSGMVDISEIAFLPNIKELTLSFNTHLDMTPIYNLDLTRLIIINHEYDMELVLNNMCNLVYFASNKLIKIKQLKNIYNESLMVFRNGRLTFDVKNDMTSILESFPNLEILGEYDLRKYNDYYEDCLRTAKLNIVGKLTKEV